MLNGIGDVNVRDFPPVLFYFWETIAVHFGHVYVLVLWHNTKVGMIGAVHVREFSPISNNFIYFASIRQKDPCCVTC